MSRAWAGGSTRAHRRARAHVLHRDGYTCQLRLPGCLTHAPLHPTAGLPAGQAHHTKGKSVTGDDPAHMVAACAPCNQAVGDPRRQTRFSPAQGPSDIHAPLSSLSPDSSGSMEIRPELEWNPEVLRRWSWLKPFARVARDASPPLAMSLPPADAVGSHGAGAIRWIEDSQRIKLRWWQRLAITRQLEHRADGSLCHRTVVESTPRRAGKSVRLRGVALWRMAHAELLGEVQTVIHTGSDVAICREIQRGAWRWAEEVAGWTVSRANGKEAIESKDGDRWLVRAQRAVYGYDVCLGIVDEGWDVAPDAVSEGLEPAMLERMSPQLHLTSTAHRRATSLMRTYLAHALATDDPEVLLLLWGARPGSDVADPAVWRAASPYWSEDRRKMIAAKYEKALAGQSDPEVDDPDPIAGFEAQYLNVWRLKEPAVAGDPVVSAQDWAGLAEMAPDRVPDAVAVEDQFGGSVAVARAWLLDARVVVSVSSHDDLGLAAAEVSGLGVRRPVLVGASLAEDPVWAQLGVRVVGQSGHVRTVVADLDRLLADDVLRHDGGEVLSGQVLALRTSPGVDGPRVRSTDPANAVKAVVWAAVAARTMPPPQPRSRVF